MTIHKVAEKDEIANGERTLVEINGKTIGVFKIDGEYFAYPNTCPHQGGPICAGELEGTTEGTFDPEKLEFDIQWTKEGEILVCPWHGWECNLKTGHFQHNQDIELPSYQVEVRDDDVVLIV